jgi:hypothetical protein
MFFEVVAAFALFVVVVRLAFRKRYKVHSSGAILITGSSTGIGNSLISEASSDIQCPVNMQKSHFGIGKHAALEIAKMGYITLAGIISC